MNPLNDTELTAVEGGFVWPTPAGVSPSTYGSPLREIELRRLLDWYAEQN